LPEDVNVHLISKEDECDELELLLGHKYIGMDLEWSVAVGFGKDEGVSRGRPAIL